MPTSKNLINFLTAPARVASKMDWKKTASTVLAVDIGPDRIGLAVAPHPASCQPVQTLEPIRLQKVTRGGNRRRLSEECIETMAAIVKEHSVCALLVSWPVQVEGRCGKPCGQVLHTLDNLLEESNAIVTKHRPVCLWDDRHVKFHVSDEWGRDPLFGKCTATRNKKVHLASQEQYQHHDCSSAVAAQVWHDFVQAHWPEMAASASSSASSASANLDAAVETAVEEDATNDNNNDCEERILSSNDDVEDEDEEEYQGLKLAAM